MTQQQKDQISKLRSEGYPIPAISEALGLSKDTVKTHCRRHGLKPSTAADKNKKVADGCFCRSCGAPLEQTKGKRTRLFCSDRCRSAWWNAHRERSDGKAVYRYSCAKCGQAFTAYGNSHRKYCSHACYISDRFGEGNA